MLGGRLEWEEMPWDVEQAEKEVCTWGKWAAYGLMEMGYLKL